MNTGEGTAHGGGVGVRGWVIIAAAVVFVILAVRDILAERKAFATYQPADAVITEVTVESRSGRRGRRWHKPVVRYAYEIEGIQHNGSRLRWTVRSVRDSLEAARAVAPYKPGQRVTVYVNPNNAAESFFLREASAVGAASPTLLMLAFLGVGYWVVVARRRRPQVVARKAA
jgi:hypothetical protein